MKFSRLSVAFYVALVFASGVLVGGFGYRLYTVSPVNAKATPRNPEEFRRRVIDEYRTRLKLSDAQVRNLNAIMDETRSRFDEAHKRIEPELATIRKEQTEKVRSMLDPTQRAEYDRMRAEREQRMREKGSGHKGPGM